MACIALQCSGVRCGAVQCSAVQCSAVQCSALLLLLRLLLLFFVSFLLLSHVFWDGIWNLEVPPRLPPIRSQPLSCYQLVWTIDFGRMQALH